MNQSTRRSCDGNNVLYIK